jgi:hypothetical protein
VAAFSMISNVSIYLNIIYYLFPNVQHLTINSLPANASEQVQFVFKLSHLCWF